MAAFTKKNELERLQEQRGQLAVRIAEARAREIAARRRNTARLESLVGRVLLADGEQNLATTETIRGALLRTRVISAREIVFLIESGWLPAASSSHSPTSC